MGHLFCLKGLGMSKDVIVADCHVLVGGAKEKSFDHSLWKAIHSGRPQGRESETYDIVSRGTSRMLQI